MWPDVPKNLPYSGHGWLNEENKAVIGGYLRAENKPTVIEIGTWLGLSARFMVDCGATVWAIDHWKGSPEHYGNPDWEKFLPTLWDQFVVDCWNYKDDIHPVKMDAHAGMEFLHQSGVKPFMVYIDGAHNYDQVRRDIADARHFFPGARIIGDDWGWDGVRRAASDIASDCGLILNSYGNCWWYELSGQ